MLFACGANYFNQLGMSLNEDQEKHPNIVSEFKEVVVRHDGALLNIGHVPIWTGRTQTALFARPNTLTLLGHDSKTLSFEPSRIPTDLPQQQHQADNLNPSNSTRGLISILSTNEAIQAVLHRAGILLFPSSDGTSPSLEPHSPPGPLLSHLGSTSAGQTIAIPLQAPGAGVFHMLSWSSFSSTSPSPPSPALASAPQTSSSQQASFLAWHAAPSHPSNAPNSHTTHNGTPKSLVSTRSALALLTSHGDVYTAGDWRFPRPLGRNPTSREPAGQMCIVPELQGARITRLAGASGGWAFGAVSEGGDAWVWGMPSGGHGGHGGTQGARSWIEGVGECVGEGIYRVVLPAEDEDADGEGREGEGEGAPGAQWSEHAPEIRALALGAEHALALDEFGRVLSIGRDSHGQLGLGASPSQRTLAARTRERIVNACDAKARSDVVQRDGASVLGQGETVCRWRKIDDAPWRGKRVVDVGAGDVASFVVVE